MTTHTKSLFQVTAWDESPYDQAEGAPKLTRATVTKTFSGAIEGSSSVEYLMTHRADDTASFVGQERITGSLDGRAGSFVLEHIGTFQEGAAKATCAVVPGSGTGELESLRSSGRFDAASREVRFRFDYDFD